MLSTSSRKTGLHPPASRTVSFSAPYRFYRHELLLCRCSVFFSLLLPRKGRIPCNSQRNENGKKTQARFQWMRYELWLDWFLFPARVTRLVTTLNVVLEGRKRELVRFRPPGRPSWFRFGGLPGFGSGDRVPLSLLPVVTTPLANPVAPPSPSFIFWPLAGRLQSGRRRVRCCSSFDRLPLLPPLPVRWCWCGTSRSGAPVWAGFIRLRPVREIVQLPFSLPTPRRCVQVRTPVYRFHALRRHHQLKQKLS